MKYLLLCLLFIGCSHDHTTCSVEILRSSQWPALQKKHLKQHPFCEACSTPTNLNVHHVKPYHLYPELELDPTNLITLCRTHHFTIGHDPDGPWNPMKPNWKLENKNVWKDARKWALNKKRYSVKDMEVNEYVIQNVEPIVGDIANFFEENKVQQFDAVMALALMLTIEIREQDPENDFVDLLIEFIRRSVEKKIQKQIRERN